MRKDTPDKAKRLIQQLVNQRMRVSHPVMGGHPYHEVVDAIMEENDSQVTTYLRCAMDDTKRLDWFEQNSAKLSADPTWEFWINVGKHGFRKAIDMETQKGAQ